MSLGQKGVFLFLQSVQKCRWRQLRLTLMFVLWLYFGKKKIDRKWHWQEIKINFLKISTIFFINVPATKFLGSFCLNHCGWNQFFFGKIWKSSHVSFAINLDKISIGFYWRKKSKKVLPPSDLNLGLLFSSPLIPK